MRLIAGKPVIAHLIERIQSVKEVSSVMLATSNKEENGIFQEYANQIGIKCFVDSHGDEEDVLGRLLRAGEEVEADHIVRYTGDNPLIYLGNLGWVVRHHIDEGADLTFTKKLPLGAFSEIISITAMERAYLRYGKRYHNAMVTLCMKENPDDFKVEILTPPMELQRPELRMTVDTELDVEIISTVYQNLQKPNQFIRLLDIISFLDKTPELLEKNISVPYKSDTRIWD